MGKYLSILILLTLFLATDFVLGQEHILGTLLDKEGNEIKLIVKSKNEIGQEPFSFYNYGGQIEYLYALKNGVSLDQNETIEYFAKYLSYLNINNINHLDMTIDDIQRGAFVRIDEENNYSVLYLALEDDIKSTDAILQLYGKTGGDSDGLFNPTKRRELWSDVFLSCFNQMEIINDAIRNDDTYQFRKYAKLKLQIALDQIKSENNADGELVNIIEDLLSNNSGQVELETPPQLNAFFKLFDLLADYFSDSQIVGDISANILLLKSYINVLDISSKISVEILNTLLIQQFQGAESDYRIKILQNWLNNYEGKLFDSEVINGFNLAIDKYNIKKDAIYESIKKVISDKVLMVSTVNTMLEVVGHFALESIKAKGLASGLTIKAGGAILFAVTTLAELAIEIDDRYDLARYMTLAGTLEMELNIYMDNNFKSIDAREDIILEKLHLFQIRQFLGYYFYENVRQIYEPTWGPSDLLFLTYELFRGWDWDFERKITFERRERNIKQYWNTTSPYYFSFDDVSWFQQLYNNYEKYILNGSINAAFEVKQNLKINESVQFKDLSTSLNTDITSWNWDFDGDGIFDSNEQNPIYTYSTGGKYSVSLEVSDGVKIDKVTKDDHIFVTYATQGHDLGITNLSTGKQWYKPGQNIDLEFLIKNYGVVDQSDFVTSLYLKTDRGEVLDKKEISTAYLVSNDIVKIKNSLVTDNLAAGFYNLEVEVKLLTDFNLGNNKQVISIYIGEENPFVTYTYDADVIDMYQSTDLGSYNVKVTNITEDRQQIKVDIEKIGGGLSLSKVTLKRGELYFYDAYRAFLKFRDVDFGAGSQLIFLDYGEFADNVTFEPANLVDVEAGTVARYACYSNKDDSSPNVRFYDTGLDETDEMFNWKLESYPYKFPYNNIYVDISVPLSAERKKYNFWIRLDADGDFIRKLSMEVIDPKPSFQVIASQSKLTLAPQISKTINFSINPLNNFNDKIILTSDNVPSGVTVEFNKNNFTLPNSVDAKFIVDENFSDFDIYQFDINVSSSNKREVLKIDAEIIDASQNYISITNVQYIDKDEKKDSLKVYFDSDFQYAEKAITTDWQYLLNNSWVNINENEILNNELRPPGKDYILWDIQDTPLLLSKQCQFRMKNKNGNEFLTPLSSQNLHNDTQGHNEDFSGISIVNDIIYLIDIKESPVRVRTFDLSYNILTSYALSDVPFGEHLELTYRGGYFYVHGYDIDKVWCFNSNFQLLYSKTVTNELRTIFEFNGKLFAYYEGTIDYFVELDNNLNEIGDQILTPFNDHAEFSFSDGKNVWIGYGNDLTKISPDFQSFEEFTDKLSIFADYGAYYNGKLYLTKETMDIFLYSFYDPYSFFSTSQIFELNNTYKPSLVDIPNILIDEDQSVDSVLNLKDFIADLDTDNSLITVEITRPIPNINASWTDSNSTTLSLIPAKDWYGNGSLGLLLDDGINSVEDSLIIEVKPINDPPILEQIPELIVYEDDTLTFPLSQYIHDVDNELSDLNISLKTLTELPNNEELIVYSIVDSTKDLKIITQKDFFQDSIMVELKVNDFKSSSQDTIILHIRPINDKPLAFSRISPEDKTYIYQDTIRFIWNRSLDIEQDSIIYEIAMYNEPADSVWEGPDSTFLKNVLVDTTFCTKDTTFNLAVDIFEPVDTLNKFYWVVVAKDNSAMTIAENGAGYFYLYSSLVNAENDLGLPIEYKLSQNYPNPFNPSTTIEYSLPKQTEVILEIYNILGQRIIELVNGEQKAGYYKYHWQGVNQFGSRVSTGVYFYRIIAGDFVKTKKMILMK